MAERLTPFEGHLQVRRPHRHRNSGGWKLAYADFTTAMMAFFLLMWIISGTEQDTRADLAEYFGGEAQRDVGEHHNTIEETLRRLADMQGLSGRYRIYTDEQHLRIEFFETPEHPMFALGSGELSDDAQSVLKAVAPLIVEVDAAFEIEGHTDSLPIASGHGSNWQLSAQRAEAARQVLIEAGVPGARILGITGRGASLPILANDPGAAPNRRISLIFKL